MAGVTPTQQQLITSLTEVEKHFLTTWQEKKERTREEKQAQD